MFNNSIMENESQRSVINVISKAIGMLIIVAQVLVAVFCLAIFIVAWFIAPDESSDIASSQLENSIKHEFVLALAQVIGHLALFYGIVWVGFLITGWYLLRDNNLLVRLASPQPTRSSASYASFRSESNSANLDKQMRATIDVIEDASRWAHK